MRSSVKDLFRYIKPDLHYFFIAFASVLLSALTILFFCRSLSSIIDSNVKQDFTSKLALAVFTVLAISITAFTRLYFIGIGSERVIARIRYDLYSNIINLQPSFFENTGVQDVISVLINDTSMLQSIVNSSLITVLRNFVILIGSIAMLLYLDLHLTAYVAGITLVLLLIITSLGRVIRNYACSAQNKLNELTSLSEENFKSIVTIKSFVLEKNEKARFEKYLSSLSSSQKRLVLLRSTLVALIVLCVISSLVILIFFGIREVVNYKITVGELSSFMFYSALAAGAVNSLSDNINDFQQGLLILERLSQLKNKKSSIVDADKPIKIYSLKKGVSFNNVTFFYESSRHSRPSLNDVSFFIEVGQTVSIVGPTGSGKSTILRLLLRFYDPSEGSITIDEHDIKLIKISNLRSLFGLVPQDHMIFSCSIMENILYGKPWAKYKEVVQAAVSAYAMEFIDKLPNKFKTFVGKRGLKLSEGQKQRIIIARAILKNPQILVLDEATSALDYKSESLVQKAISKLMQNRTTIMVTHRLSNIFKTDKIIVINHGEIEEVGTHESLITKDGLYAKLLRGHCY